MSGRKSSTGARRKLSGRKSSTGAGREIPSRKWSTSTDGTGTKTLRSFDSSSDSDEANKLNPERLTETMKDRAFAKIGERFPNLPSGSDSDSSSDSDEAHKLDKLSESMKEQARRKILPQFSNLPSVSEIEDSNESDANPASQSVYERNFKKFADVVPPPPPLEAESSDASSVPTNSEYERKFRKEATVFPPLPPLRSKRLRKKESSSPKQKIAEYNRLVPALSPAPGTSIGTVCTSTPIQNKSNAHQSKFELSSVISPVAKPVGMRVSSRRRPSTRQFSDRVLDTMSEPQSSEDDSNPSPFVSKKRRRTTVQTGSQGQSQVNPSQVYGQIINRHYSLSQTGSVFTKNGTQIQVSKSSVASTILSPDRDLISEAAGGSQSSQSSNDNMAETPNPTKANANTLPRKPVTFPLTVTETIEEEDHVSIPHKNIVFKKLSLEEPMPLPNTRTSVRRESITTDLFTSPRPTDVRKNLVEVSSSAAAEVDSTEEEDHVPVPVSHNKTAVKPVVIEESVPLPKTRASVRRESIIKDLFASPNTSDGRESQVEVSSSAATEVDSTGEVDHVPVPVSHNKTAVKPVVMEEPVPLPKTRASVRRESISKDLFDSPITSDGRESQVEISPRASAEVDHVPVPVSHNKTAVKPVVMEESVSLPKTRASVRRESITKDLFASPNTLDERESQVEISPSAAAEVDHVAVAVSHNKTAVKPVVMDESVSLPKTRASVRIESITKDLFDSPITSDGRESQVEDSPTAATEVDSTEEEDHVPVPVSHNKTAVKPIVMEESVAVPKIRASVRRESITKDLFASPNSSDGRKSLAEVSSSAAAEVDSTGEEDHVPVPVSHNKTAVIPAVIEESVSLPKTRASVRRESITKDLFDSPITSDGRESQVEDSSTAAAEVNSTEEEDHVPVAVSHNKTAVKPIVIAESVSLPKTRASVRRASNTKDLFASPNSSDGRKSLAEVSSGAASEVASGEEDHVPVRVSHSHNKTAVKSVVIEESVHLLKTSASVQRESNTKDLFASPNSSDGRKGLVEVSSRNESDVDSTEDEDYAPAPVSHYKAAVKTVAMEESAAVPETRASLRRKISTKEQFASPNSSDGRKSLVSVSLRNEAELDSTEDEDYAPAPVSHKSAVKPVTMEESVALPKTRALLRRKISTKNQFASSRQPVGWKSQAENSSSDEAEVVLIEEDDPAPVSYNKSAVKPIAMEGSVTLPKIRASVQRKSITKEVVASPRRSDSRKRRVEASSGDEAEGEASEEEDVLASASVSHNKTAAKPVAMEESVALPKTKASLRRKISTKKQFASSKKSVGSKSHPENSSSDEAEVDPTEEDVPAPASHKKSAVKPVAIEGSVTLPKTRASVRRKSITKEVVASPRSSDSRKRRMAVSSDDEAEGEPSEEEDVPASTSVSHNKTAAKPVAMEESATLSKTRASLRRKISTKKQFASSRKHVGWKSQAENTSSDEAEVDPSEEEDVPAPVSHKKSAVKPGAMEGSMSLPKIRASVRRKSITNELVASPRRSGGRKLRAEVSSDDEAEGEPSEEEDVLAGDRVTLPKTRASVRRKSITKELVASPRSSDGRKRRAEISLDDDAEGELSEEEDVHASASVSHNKTAAKPVAMEDSVPLTKTRASVRRKISTKKQFASSRQPVGRKSQVEVSSDDAAEVEASPVAPKSKKARKQKADDWFNDNSNMLSLTHLSNYLTVTNRKISSKDLAHVHKVFNSNIEKIMDRLCDNALRPHGMFTFKQLEAALKAEKLIGDNRYELRIEMMNMFTPTQYRKLKGVILPQDHEEDNPYY